jgi:hypothetical protein
MMHSEDAVTCHWLTPTRIMPHPFCLDAATSPWTCLRDGRPRALSMAALHNCVACPRWEPRSLDSTKRDLAFETWGVGIPIPEHRTLEDRRRDLLWETWGL